MAGKRTGRTEVVRRASGAALVAMILGATAAGTVLTAGAAAADPGARSSHSNGRGPADPRDTTGWRHIDPRGYHHLETNQLRQNEIRDNRREYRQRHNAPQEPQRALGTDPGATTWTKVPNADGTGWAVCRPQASYC